MKTLPGIATVLCILMLSGCASNLAFVQPIVGSKQVPSSTSGYVAGMFSQDWQPGKLGFGLGIVDTATAEQQYVMPFGSDTILPNAVVDQFGMIQLPPGEYRIENWQIYSTKNKEQMIQTSIQPDSVAGLPFTLAPGEVVFIGSYVARNGGNGSSEDNSTWSVRHQQLTLPLVQKALSKRYPAFAKQPLSCPSCLK